jgi:hypothetical protein
MIIISRIINFHSGFTRQQLLSIEGQQLDGGKLRHGSSVGEGKECFLGDGSPL